MDTEQQEDLRRIVVQEKTLQLKAFDKAAAWELGLRLKKLCEEIGAGTTIETRLERETVFFYAMPGTASSNADWARRKRNVVELMGQSSYRLALSFEDGNSLEASMAPTVHASDQQRSKGSTNRGVADCALREGRNS